MTDVQPPETANGATTTATHQAHEQTVQPTRIEVGVAQPALGAVAAVTIRRFKCIEDLTLTLDSKPTVMIGANNGGKSSILHAIHFAVSVAQTAKLVGEGVNWGADEFKLSFNPTQLLWSPVADAMSLAKGGILTEDQTRQIEITIRDTSGTHSTIAVRRGRNRNISVVLRGRALGERLQNLEHPFSVYTPGLAGIARQEQFLSPGVVRRAVARGDANLVLRNVLLMLQQDSDKWRLFLRDIRSLFPGIDYSVRFDANTDETITTTVRIDGGPELPLDAAGTAVLQATQILGYSVLYNPPLVLLDEPDSHLHPNNQRSLCKILTTLSHERGFRLIIATHSRHVLDALRGRSSVAWLSQGGIVPQTRESITSRLLDLGALDSADFFADTQTKCVVITEDSDTEALEALLWSSGFVEDDTRVASYAGCSKLESAVVLGQFIETHANNVEVVVHRDRDFMNEEEATQYRDSINNCDLTPFITDGNDVEWHYVNAAHLVSLNPGLSLETANQIIDEVLDETREASISAIVNIRMDRALRERARTGQQPNAGAIATAAAREYDANPRLACHGKTVLGPLKARIQQSLGRNPRIFEPSEHLVVPSLREIANQIWADDA